MKTCNAWPADYTKNILGNSLEIARTIFTQKNVVGINCVIISASIVHFLFSQRFLELKLRYIYIA